MAWRLHSSHAHLESGPWTAFVDVTQPARGLYGWQCEQRSMWGDELWNLQVELPEAPAGGIPLHDSFVRGEDLVANYGPTPQQQFAPQIYWRQWSEEPVYGVEVIVSLRTELLDSSPQVTLRSKVPADVALGLPSAAATGPLSPLPPVETLATASAGAQSWLLFRRGDAQASYLEMVHPTDFHRVEVRHAEGRFHSEWTLFPDRLEKGVIRRGRARGLWIPREGDEARAVQLFEQFRRSEIPLTA